VSIEAAVRTMVTGFNHREFVYGGQTRKGLFIQRPITIEDEIDGQVTLAGESIRCMRVDVPGIARGSTLTIAGASRVVRDVHADRNGHSVTLVLAGGSAG
jgi:hypothetical protein